jgi:predicted SPOUT superfamily RNA methylase MTH1
LLLNRIYQKAKKQIGKEFMANSEKIKCEKIQEEVQEVSNIKQSSIGVKKHTLSIVVPASIIDNAQSFELKTYLVCQIARAAVIYNVDEIIVVQSRGKFAQSLAKTNPTEFFVRNLEYLETPPYLRKALFPVCPELKYSGLMNPLNPPYHFRPDQWSQYREGVVINRPIKKAKGSWINTGLRKETQVDLCIEEGKFPILIV